MPKEGGAAGVLEQEVKDRRGFSKRERSEGWVWAGTELGTVRRKGFRSERGSRVAGKACSSEKGCR